MLAGDGAGWRDGHDGVTVRGDLDKELTRPVVRHRFWVRSGRGGRHPPGRASERQSPDYGAAVAVLAAQAVERGGGSQVAGAVVEELAGQRARLVPIGGLTRGQPGRRLDHAVKAPPAGPRNLMAPGVEDHDDRPGVTLTKPFTFPYWRIRKYGLPEPVKEAGMVLDHGLRRLIRVRRSLRRSGRR